MGHTLKFVSGIILLITGVIISYGVMAYNLIDMLLMVGFLISIVGIILIISYFVDSNAEKTSGLIKEFLDSRNIGTSSINLSKKSHSPDFDKNGPLVMRPRNDDYDYGKNIDDSGLWEYYESEQNKDLTPSEYYDEDVDESKAVLHVVNREEKEIDLDKELDFTPSYEKPVKVTRKPKKRSADHIYDSIPVEENVDKTEEIKKALSQDIEPQVRLESTPNPRDIEIDVNNPERLPIPDSLKGNVLLGNDLVTSNDAFEQLDISYAVLIASLLKQGVHIKTVPKVHTVNLITDDSHAMIISDGYTTGDSEYGAIYEDRISISTIRADFEKTWNIASNLDENVLLNSIGGTA